MQEDKCVWCKAEGMDIRLETDGSLVRICDECPYTDEFFAEYEDN